MEWLTAFLLTLLIESPCLLILLKEHKAYRVVSAGFLMNALSHPAFWFVLPPLLPDRYYIPLGEVFVVLLEAAVLYIFFRKEGIKKLLLISFILNLISFSVGEAIYLLQG